LVKHAQVHDVDEGHAYDVVLSDGLTEQGFAATGLDPLSRCTSVPKGSSYNYFGSTADLAKS
jgi:hypothetical protein